MSSTRLIKLKEQLEYSKNLFLPATIDPTGGSYTQKDVDLSVGYIATAHAAIQHYFDDKCRELLKSTIDAFNNREVLTREIIGFFAYLMKDSDRISRDYEKNLNSETQLASAGSNPEEHMSLLTKQLINNLSQRYEKIRQENNGIKTSNLTELLLPLGFPINQLHPDFLSILNGLGEARGRNVHKSLGTTIIGNPYDYYNEVQKAMYGPKPGGQSRIFSIEIFDDVIEERKSTMREVYFPDLYV